jgi:hypothetical protein
LIDPVMAKVPVTLPFWIVPRNAVVKVAATDVIANEVPVTVPAMPAPSTCVPFCVSLTALGPISTPPLDGAETQQQDPRP